MDAGNFAIWVAGLIGLLAFGLAMINWAVDCYRKGGKGGSGDSSGSQFQTFSIDKFLSDMEREKPIRFTYRQLRTATQKFSNKLGSGGFGVVYLGILSNGINVAVKVLHGNSDKGIEQQFMAEVSTIGRVHHFNLVKLYGFCFERKLRALVYEYLANGSLDKYLFHEDKTLGFEKLHGIAVGTARGIAYLHEGCQPRIVHYDIKPANILLDEEFYPKVADFGLAKLCSRSKTHITMPGGRGTPGYIAPEVWLSFPVTYKCDVYSFGMLLFEMIGRRRNFETNHPESQEWFPRWVWKKFESGLMGELRIVCGVDEKYMEIVERMAKVALWCIHYTPELRPPMGVVVKMLEGVVDIQNPLNPFQTMMVGTLPALPNHPSDSTAHPGFAADESSIINASPVMRKFEIELASSS